MIDGAIVYPIFCAAMTHFLFKRTIKQATPTFITVLININWHVFIKLQLMRNISLMKNLAGIVMVFACSEIVIQVNQLIPIINNKQYLIARWPPHSLFFIEKNHCRQSFHHIQDGAADWRLKHICHSQTDTLPDCSTCLTQLITNGSSMVSHKNGDAALTIFLFLNG